MNASFSKLTGYEKAMAVLFLLSLPFLNPWVRGDGVGYYAFARAMLVQHNLDFSQDWAHANESFKMARFDRQGDDESIAGDQFTATGHLNNHFSIGPAILWAPFLLVAQGVAVVAKLPTDGFSRPYLLAMALGTAIYGFASLWISFRIARRYFPERWAFLATLGIWFGSSLPVYMYFNPSWSHAQSAFVVALFVWYWLRTRESRPLHKWFILGCLGGLMMDVYYTNAVVLLLPACDVIADYREAAHEGKDSGLATTLGGMAFSVALFICFLPTLVTKKIIYGSYLNLGYTEQWRWTSPAFLKVLFSSDHGFVVWTPVLALAILGLMVVVRRDWKLGLPLLSVVILYVYVIGCYQDWDGISSFGNRFFVSLTPIFLIGLAAFFNWLAELWGARPTLRTAAVVTTVLVAANLGLMFQWGMHLIPARGPISLATAACNDLTVVPVRAADALKAYLTARSGLMHQIEGQDVKQLKSASSGDVP
jgi:hypothetical protein